MNSEIRTVVTFESTAFNMAEPKEYFINPCCFVYIAALCRGRPLQREGFAVYNHNMAKDVIHISEAEATNDFASLMARVREGAEVIIEKDARPVAIVRPAEPHVRLLSESLRLAKEHGSTATLDGDFGRDLEEIINSHREPLNPPAWD